MRRQPNRNETKIRSRPDWSPPQIEAGSADGGQASPDVRDDRGKTAGGGVVVAGEERDGNGA